MSNLSPRATFGGRLSAVLVTAGSAVGLGNIWRFPYVAGENGGGAFLIVYLLSVALIGLPVMLAEFAVGRHTHRNAVGAYRTLSRRWTLLGYNSILAPLLILGFYLVVSGWTLEYTVHSLTGEFARCTTSDDYRQLFENFTANPWRPVGYTVLFALLTHAVIALGVRRGIERSAKLLMPLLLVMLAVLAVRAVTLPGGGEGLRFFFTPDFSKVTARTVLVALGQAFFSLSIGLGILVTYASYFRDDTDMPRTAVQVTLIDTLVAVLAGVVIFPATFSAGIAPGSGPALAFITLPSIFNTMPLGMVWSTIFFLLLAVAALTSTISLHEVLTAYVHEEWHLRRGTAAWVVTGVVTLLGAAASLSVGAVRALHVGSLSLFDALDFVTANIMLPLSGMLVCLLVGWFLDRRFLRDEATNRGTLRVRMLGPAIFLLRWICPVVILLIFLDNLGLL